MKSGIQTSSAAVDSLIVRYESGKKPSREIPILGTERVTAVPKNELSLAEYLGFQMYKVNFRTPVSSQVARRVATQMTRSAAVEFAELNQTVSIQNAVR
jgi:hypothetical protein